MQPADGGLSIAKMRDGAEEHIFLLWRAPRAAGSCLGPKLANHYYRLCVMKNLEAFPIFDFPACATNFQPTRLLWPWKARAVRGLLPSLDAILALPALEWHLSARPTKRACGRARRAEQ